MFLVKYDSTGTVQWTRRMGGISSDQITLASTDISGNILITGTFNDTVPFGSDTLTRHESILLCWARKDSDKNDDENAHEKIYTSYKCFLKEN